MSADTTDKPMTADAVLVQQWREIEAAALHAGGTPDISKIRLDDFLSCTRNAVLSAEFVRHYEVRRSAWLCTGGVVVLIMFSVLVCLNDNMSPGLSVGFVLFQILAGHGWSELAVSIQRWIDRSRK